MNWAMAQGLIGRASKSLAPSSRAVGPNVYLARNDFFRMLGLAVLVHVLAFGVTELLPNNNVNHIPVRSLSFKLGGADRVAAYAPAPVAAVPALPAVAAPVMQATTAQTWRATPNVEKPVTPPPLKPVAKPAAVEKPMLKPVVEPVKQPKVYKVEEPAPQQPMTAQAPKQYVREVGAAPAAAPATTPVGASNGAIGGQGVVTSVSEQVAQAVRARYEQDISGWIQRHKYYPTEAAGREGRVVVRMRIDRMGNVRYYAIEQSSGLTALDAAALDMIRRANPVPAVPDNYPAGNLVEFLIPISFKAPI